MQWQKQNVAQLHQTQLKLQNKKKMRRHKRREKQNYNKQRIKSKTIILMLLMQSMQLINIVVNGVPHVKHKCI